MFTNITANNNFIHAQTEISHGDHFFANPIAYDVVNLAVLMASPLFHENGEF